MSQQNAFKRILASLYEAMLDDTLWPGTSALIDEACGITGNTLLVGEGPKDDVRVVFVGHYYRGQRREDLEREYLEVYHPIDERVPRLRQLPGQSPGACHGAVHSRGVEDLADLQRNHAPVRPSGQLERAAGAADGGCAAELRCGRPQRVDAAGPLLRGAALRGARQTRGCPATRLRSATRCGAGPDRRAGAPSASRFRRGTGTLGLRPAERQVAVSLAEGQSVRDMAEATGHAIYWHLTPIYMKRVISRQADRVRQVLSIAEFG